MTLTVRTFSKRITRRLALDYLLHLPPGYSRKRSHPLILFLHGSDECGANVQWVARHGIPRVAACEPSFPFIAVSPQCPANSTWILQADVLLLLLDEIVRTHAVDRSRVYLTGMSLGGYGAWYLGSLHPQRFAAVVPVCGGYEDMLGFPDRVEGLRYTPVWAFHGAKDKAVPASESRTLVRALRKFGGKPKLTIYPDAGHDVWTRAYADARLYRWLLKQRR